MARKLSVVEGLVGGGSGLVKATSHICEIVRFGELSGGRINVCLSCHLQVFDLLEEAIEDHV